MICNTLLRFCLIGTVFVVAVTGQGLFPSPITAECDPCRLYDNGETLKGACAESNPIVGDIISRDSSCGRQWDAYCLVEYNDCYSDACGSSSQGLIDVIASTGGPQNRPINRTQTLLNCPPTSQPSSTPSASPSSSPSASPTTSPSHQPSAEPSREPSTTPSLRPSARPTAGPSSTPSSSPSASPSAAPTPDPSAAPSLRPSAGPSSSPTTTPSASPTNVPTVNPECVGRPWVMTFQYTGGNCAQSDNLQTSQKFSCTDVAGGPPTDPGTTSYITAVPRGGRDTYFAGRVSLGEQYTLNANKQYDKLAADMTITIYDEQDGNVLQVVNMHLSCSQPLVLFDKFGANQVLQFMETSGRIIENRQVEIEHEYTYGGFT